jgi:hypothetical protein
MYCSSELWHFVVWYDTTSILHDHQLAGSICMSIFKVVVTQKTKIWMHTTIKTLNFTYPFSCFQLGISQYFHLHVIRKFLWLCH